ncbi:carboxynorspermidine decarboxylase [Oscillospiraceae bacterium LTW-04]|nr:carboxynorspermidine decarboxylase [Oscillospiraceae bacterium MB24-C1]
MKLSDLPTPCFVVDEALLEQNLKILQGVMQRTGCKILLAQKAFSLYKLYPLIGQYLSGTAASGLYEARLGCEEMGKENHVFSPAYREAELVELTKICGHIVFNSFSQLERFGAQTKAAGCEIGLRLNPECSTQQGHAVYDPCSPNSRLGVTRANFRPELLDSVSGFHFHTLCEQNSDALLTTVTAIEEQFGEWLPQMKWLNLGGGHHITRPDYNISALEQCINRLQNQYDLQVYLEPGEAVALNAGFLVTSVLDTLKNGMDIAILDVSAACHMPDVLEMPYRPPLQDSGLAEEKACTYRLGGPTCLAGDIIGDYSFDQPLKAGDRLVFGDMAIYSMVKTNTFNGMPLPAIALRDHEGDCRILNRFGYMDFKGRLA